MTRGKIVVILNNNIMLVSTDFNGDMNYEMHGINIIECLKKIENENDYKNFIEEFNFKNFGYEGELVFRITDNDYIEYLNMAENYFYKWFSDYIYIKNLSDNEVYFISDNGEKVGILSNEIGVFYYGDILYNIKVNK